MLGVVLPPRRGLPHLRGEEPDETRIALLVVAAAAMPLRLLCNMLDGMLAVEGGLTTPERRALQRAARPARRSADPRRRGLRIGEVPWGPELGWAAATTALLTAYVRTLGAAAGASHHFVGPMAKPRRMHVLIAACLSRPSRPPSVGGGTGVVVALSSSSPGGS